MNHLFPFLLLVTMCAAIPQDLTGKMFTFPQDSNTAYVRLYTSIREFRKFTVCQRYFTDLKRDHVLFSYSTSTTPNTILVIWDKAHSELEAYVKDKHVWFDGQPTIRKFTTTATSIAGDSIIIVGQEQDSHGGRFDTKQSFVGMLSDIHMWDYILSPNEIHKYMNELSFTPGNALNWAALEFRIFSKVFIEEKQTGCV